ASAGSHDTPRSNWPRLRTAISEVRRWMSDRLKQLAAAAALEEVVHGMRHGLGTGSTAEHLVRLLGERVRGGLDVEGVPTSERTAALAGEHGIRLATLDELPKLDLTIDGADELDGA